MGCTQLTADMAGSLRQADSWGTLMADVGVGIPEDLLALSYTSWQSRAFPLRLPSLSLPLESSVR